MTTTAFKSPSEDLAAIRASAAVFPLASRSFLRITGPDATRWLNGMVTNNVTVLVPGEGSYNFLLNSQGRIQGDCTIYREFGDGPAAYLLETDTSQIEAIQSHLDKFIIMDDVELFPLPLSGVGVIGPNAFRLLARLALGENQEVISAASASPAAVFHAAPPAPDALTLVPPSTAPLFEIWFPTQAHADAFVDRLHDFGAADASPQALEAFRLLTATPKFGVDITEKYLPQETAQTHALHFSKGCYLGQEIVERIHSRGQVHRTFAQFTLTGEMPQFPAPLESNGKPAGELTSAALIDGTLYALGYTRREILDTDQPLTYAEGVATPSRRPKLTT